MGKGSARVEMSQGALFELGDQAVFSEDNRYRYVLYRKWSEGSRFVQFIGLNPSTADAIRNDPTMRKCIGFAKRWGFDGMAMTNLFGYRATKREVMKRQADPVGPNNDTWLVRTVRDAALIVCCWGVDGIHLKSRRGGEVFAQ